MKEPVHRLFARIEKTHWWFTARRRILEDVVHSLLRPGNGGTVVDVGCGTGANIAALALDYRCIGLDTAPAAIDLAKREYPCVEFVQGEAPDALGARAAEADLFLLTDVLEHVQDDRALLGSVVAAARPGARFLITVPADERLWSRHDEEVSHYRRYEVATLRAVWADLPVREIAFTHFNSRLLPAVWLVRRLNRLRSFGATVAEFTLPPTPVNRVLERVFLGERHVVVRALRGGAGYRRGVSILAAIERVADSGGAVT